MFPPLRHLDWVYEDTIESMENGRMDTLMVNFGYFSGEGHDACGWMAVEGRGMDTGECAAPFASLGFQKSFYRPLSLAC